jgi:7-methyl-GTP pyrophosphatase
VRTLVLASTSPYRRKLLRQLELPFLAAAPRFEEELGQGVAPELLVKHLATQKAKSLVAHYPDALIIGADQVFVDQRGRIIGKPGSADQAIRQLRGMAGRQHTFYTGLCVLDSRSGMQIADFETYSVTLRSLSDDEIAAYVRKENPVDCAGSFKIEGLGIALMQEMSGRDFNALIGLPLIKLIDILEQFDLRPLQSLEP